MDLSRAKVIVVVFVMKGCGACEEYKPIFNKVAAAYKNEFPIFIYDVSNPDDKLTAFADRFGVTATPTTVVARRGAGFFKAEGSQAAHEVKALLDTARRVQREG